MRLAVIFQVVQALAQRLGGHAAAAPPGEGDQYQVRLLDATGPCADGTVAVELHRDVGHGAAVFEGNGWRVAPAACRAKKTGGAMDSNSAMGRLGKTPRIVLQLFCVFNPSANTTKDKLS